MPGVYGRCLTATPVRPRTRLAQDLIGKLDLGNGDATVLVAKKRPRSQSSIFPPPASVDMAATSSLWRSLPFLGTPAGDLMQLERRPPSAPPPSGEHLQADQWGSTDQRSTKLPPPYMGG
jgi:hypothetical protein